MDEKWLPVVDFEDYSISDRGRVYSTKTSKVLKPQKLNGGHLYVTLWSNGVGTRFLIHRLVLTAFVGRCPDGQEGCHKDDVPWNNVLSNLKWDTRSGNLLDSVRNGHHVHANKERCAKGHPFTRKVLEQDGHSHRKCAQCMREQSAVRKLKHLCSECGNPIQLTKSQREQGQTAHTRCLPRVEYPHGTRERRTRGCKCVECKAAMAAYQRARVASDPEKTRVRARENYARNRLKIRMQQRDYYARNRDSIQERRRVKAKV